MKYLQAEHKEWVDRMFPGQEPWYPASCMVEEAGELLHCFTKHEQASRFGTEPRYAGVDWRAKLMDAVGDCAISCCSLCNANRWDFELVGWGAEVAIDGASELALISELIQSAAKLAVTPTIKLHAMVYMAILRQVSFAFDVDFDEAIAVTWEEVKRRTR